jgi:uncharacterized protein DUF2786/SprT-like family protein
MIDPGLTVALERALLRELLASWRQVNEAYFKGGLRAPTIALVSSRSRLAQWVPSARTIEFARSLLVEHHWTAVVEVLKHEVAHQWVHEVLGEHAETAHGRAFRETCARLGIDARASGVPAAKGRDEREERIIERIARLLALAESPNRHEAEAAATQAQRLMLKYNLEEPPAGASARDYGHKHLGEPTGRVTEAERIVAMILGKYFFVEVIWVPVYRPREGKRGSVLEVCGTRANLAMAEYVHAFLTRTASRLWEEHKGESGSRSNRHRRTYLAGVMAGFAEKLARQSAGHRAEGLVWVKDGDLEGFFRRRHPYIRHVRHAGERRTEAFARGREAGNKIVLHRAVESRATSRGRLLPP